MTGDNHLALLALCRIKDLDWALIAREAQKPAGLDRLLAGELSEQGATAAQASLPLCAGLERIDSYRAEAEEQLAKAAERDAQLTTVLDADYPQNLRTIPNLPPFLFYRGVLRPDDTRAVAIIGTRAASEEGLRRARKMATLLVSHDVTVLSGLARGIDTAAHEATLAARGRTVAVLGTGILNVYPPENEDLAARIIDSGGLVLSQFWPAQHPARYTFPRRNVVMSGLSQGSIVIEAAYTSGAKMQARLALEHGRKVFLLRSLVEEHQWARTYQSRRGAFVVDTAEDVLKHLDPQEDIQPPADEPQMRLVL